MEGWTEETSYGERGELDVVICRCCYYIIMRDESTLNITNPF